MNYFLVIIIAYLLGSINFSIVISKVFYKSDIRQHGSKNAGSTNALRVMGKKFALFVFLGDISKGIIAVMVGNYFLGDVGKILGGIFVILGHVYPVFFKFKGGKGVATTAAMMIAFDLRLFLIFGIVFLIVLFSSKFVSLSSMIASLTIPVSMFIFYPNWIFVASGLLISLFIIYLHRTNIVRIINHEENKISFKKK